MSQKLTYEKVAGGVTTTVELIVKNSKYFELESEWELDERVFRNVFSGDENQNPRGYYLVVTIRYASIPNAELFALNDIFVIGTKNIKYYPDSNSIEHYEMKQPKSIRTIDFNETYQDGFELELRSKKRYVNPLPHDISYIGTRKIDISYMHIQIDGTLV